MFGGGGKGGFSFSQSPFGGKGAESAADALLGGLSERIGAGKGGGMSLCCLTVLSDCASRSDCAVSLCCLVVLSPSDCAVSLRCLIVLCAAGKGGAAPRFSFSSHTGKGAAAAPPAGPPEVGWVIGWLGVGWLVD